MGSVNHQIGGRPELVVFVRHGESERNALPWPEHHKIVYPDNPYAKQLALKQDFEIELTPKGLNDAETSGLFLRGLQKKYGRFHKCYDSGWARAVQTRKISLRAAGLSTTEIEAMRPRSELLLRERERGLMYSMTQSEWENNQILKDWFNHYEANPYQTRFLGGESCAELADRLRQFRLMLNEHHSGERVVVFCHEIVMRAWFIMIESLSIAEAQIAAKEQIPNCGIHVYTHHRGQLAGQGWRMEAFSPEKSGEYKRNDYCSKTELREKIASDLPNYWDSEQTPISDEDSNQIDELITNLGLNIDTEPLTRERHSVDGSIFKIVPTAVFTPNDSADIQKLVSYLYQKAKNGEKSISITPRGAGTDQAGGPLNRDLILNTSQLDQILEIGEDFVRVQPGVRYGELQQKLMEHGRYLPPYPASLELCTIGGAIANNSSGEKSVKYGDTRDYVSEIKMVLFNGEEVTFGDDRFADYREGSIQREIADRIQKIFNDSHDEIMKARIDVTKVCAGYWLWNIFDGDNCDLSKLIVGSQGTLGIITEARLRTEPSPPENKVLLAGFFGSVEAAGAAAIELHALAPSALEIVDDKLLNLVAEENPEKLSDITYPGATKIVLIAEFDNREEEERAEKTSAARSILKDQALHFEEETDEEKQDQLWKLRRSAAADIWKTPTPEKALPIIEDGAVPINQLSEFINRVYALFEKYSLPSAIWGHAGDANLHIQPFMNLADPVHRKKIFWIVDEFHNIVLDLNGCISAEHNDGILRTPYLPKQFGNKINSVFVEIKEAFDPHGVFNPGKKIQAPSFRLEEHLRTDYSLDHIVSSSEQVNR